METRLLVRWCFRVRARTEGAGEQVEDKEGAIFLHHSKEQINEVLEKKISGGESPLYLLLLVTVLVSLKQVGTGGYQGGFRGGIAGSGWDKHLRVLL